MKRNKTKCENPPDSCTDYRVMTMKKLKIICSRLLSSAMENVKSIDLAVGRRYNLHVHLIHNKVSYFLYKKWNVENKRQKDTAEDKYPAPNY